MKDNNVNHLYPHERRAGKIRVQMVAIILLGISISFILSAYRSLSRDFDGVVINKSLDIGFSKTCWLFLVPKEVLGIASDSSEIITTLKGEKPARRVGVSGIIYDQVRLLQRVTKSSYSPFIYIEDERHLDLGIQWFLWGFFGIIAAIFAYRRGEPEFDLIPLPTTQDS